MMTIPAMNPALENFIGMKKREHHLFLLMKQALLFIKGLAMIISH